MLRGHRPVRVCLFDPGTEDNRGNPSSNLGDLVIREAVEREIHSLLGKVELIRLSTHETPHSDLRRELRRSHLTLVGGSNILSSEMDKYRQWAISIRHAPSVRKAVLLGAGWWKYQDRPNIYTRIFLRLLLGRNCLHSTRDAYSKRHLESIGWRNVVNTGCPSIWPLHDKSESSFPLQKARAVLVTLTDFERNPATDQALLDLVAREYEEVFLFPQGKFDLEYLSELRVPGSILSRDFEQLRRFLKETPSLDYLGTRLHGGIFALSHGRRSLILEVDNRAREMGADWGLPTVPRDDLERIRAWIRQTLPFRISLDLDAIGKWRAQFRSLAAQNAHAIAAAGL
jgi:polysaccharide pyruvyl transferase WcaK-like protein